MFLVGHGLPAELQALVGFEHGLEVRPVGLVHVVEGVEINGDCLPRIFGEQSVDGGAKLFIGHRFGKVFDDAFVVLDTKGIEKIDEHAFVLFNKPGADEIAGNHLEGRASECGEHLGMAFGCGAGVPGRRGAPCGPRRRRGESPDRSGLSDSKV